MKAKNTIGKIYVCLPNWGGGFVTRGSSKF